jgi:hypothetical protein
MYYLLFIILVIVSILFMYSGYYFVEKENLLLATLFVLMSTMLFFTLSAAVVELEFPYTAVLSDDSIVHGTHVWGDSTAVALMYLFMGLGSIQMVYGLGTIPKLVFKLFKEWQNKRVRGGLIR